MNTIQLYHFARSLELPDIVRNGIHEQPLDPFNLIDIKGVCLTSDSDRESQRFWSYEPDDELSIRLTVAVPTDRVLTLVSVLENRRITAEFVEMLVPQDKRPVVFFTHGCLDPDTIQSVEVFNGRKYVRLTETALSQLISELDTVIELEDGRGTQREPEECFSIEGTIPKHSTFDSRQTVQIGAFY